MLVTPTTRHVLAYRREVRRLKSEGYQLYTEGLYLEMHCGGKYRSKITDVAIGPDPHTVWVKLSEG